jgi:hypothetical protein
LFGSGTVSIATSLTVQGQRPPSLGGDSSLVDLFGTNLNATSVQVGDSSNLGTFLGHGTVEGSLTNTGDLLLYGSLTVTGNYTQTTGGELFENWGLGEVLNFNGNATLSGYLILSISPQASPEAGLDPDRHDVRLPQRRVYERQQRLLRHTDTPIAGTARSLPEQLS